MPVFKMSHRGSKPSITGLVEKAAANYCPALPENNGASSQKYCSDRKLVRPITTIQHVMADYGHQTKGDRFAFVSIAV
jgi:hypothetical protein